MSVFRKIVIAALALPILWASGFGCFMLSSLSMDAEKPEQVDVIIVLTGGANRIETGLELFSQKISKNLFITGINPVVTRADIMKRSAWELPKCCIGYDLNATTTIENGIETGKWARAQKEVINTAILVTSDYHMHRGAQEIQFALPDITLYRYPVPSEGAWYSRNNLRLLFLEYHKFLYRAVIMSIKG